jgi:hypothetical protein
MDEWFNPAEGIEGRNQNADDPMVVMKEEPNQLPIISKEESSRLQEIRITSVSLAEGWGVGSTHNTERWRAVGGGRGRRGREGSAADRKITGPICVRVEGGEGLLFLYFEAILKALRCLPVTWRVLD